MLLMTE